MAQNVKQGVQHLKERGQQTVSTQQERIHEAVEAGKEAAEERRSELQSQVNM
jgi:gas vesicle protein